jgi:hypothetical protein
MPGIPLGWFVNRTFSILLLGEKSGIDWRGQQHQQIGHQHNEEKEGRHGGEEGFFGGHF